MTAFIASFHGEKHNTGNMTYEYSERTNKIDLLFILKKKAS